MAMTVSNAYRLAHGGRIDREKPLSFSFDGRRYQGYQGDSLASALLASGVHLVGRSFKYHRPRGILSMGAEEPNALIQLRRGARTEPNVRAPMIELFDGLKAESQNRWPSLEFDVGAVNSALSRLFPSGFYYKTFMWPPALWMTYEKVIRHAAGLGKAPEAPDPDRYEKINAHCDVLVVGAGPAGLGAAQAAARSGARVILCDEQSEPGGQLLGHRWQIDGAPATDWVTGALKHLAEATETTVLTRTTAIGYHDSGYVELVERVADHLAEPDAFQPRLRLWHVRAKHVILASGAIERPLVFRDNDRPGVMMASAVRGYINRYAVLPGVRAGIFTNNDDAYRTALDLMNAGAVVPAVVDIRQTPTGPLVDEVRKRGVRIMAGAAVTNVIGPKRVRSFGVARLVDGADLTEGLKEYFDADLIAMSGGWSPTVHLYCHARGKLKYDAKLGAMAPSGDLEVLSVVGSANGTLGLSDCIREGQRTGTRIAKSLGFGAGRSPRAPKTDLMAEEPTRPIWVVPADEPLGRGGKHFVDFQNDVTAADLHLAGREGYISVEHLKRYTTTGMGTDQGKTSNINALGLLSEIRNAPIPEVGTTTFRPPYTPVPFGVIAGRDTGALMDPVRTTPMHEWHVKAGALFEDVGQWKRPWYYPGWGGAAGGVNESMHDAVNRECRAVREAVGIMDATTLGKIDIRGKDAAEFLNRVYTNAWMKLGVGRCRYGLMLKEDGMVMDDGVTTRLGDNHFHMTTTTGNAAQVYAWLEEWAQTEWPDLNVYFNSVTEEWAVATVAGPKARETLTAITEGIDLSAEAFPFMAMREGTVAGIPARVYRISFSGEVSFEINVPSRYGLALWTALMAAGEPHGITPYGTEAMHVLRAEKGFIIVGQETDGTVTPLDLGMDWILSKTKPDFIGKRSLSRPEPTRADRKQLVGLLTVDPNVVLPEGGQIVEELQLRPPMTMLGHVTSSYWSEACGRSIALALVRGGRARKGQILHVPLADRTIDVEVTDPIFYDPEGERMHG